MKIISFTVNNTETNQNLPCSIFMELLDDDFENLVDEFTDHDGPVMDFYNEAFDRSIGVWNDEILKLMDESACEGPVFEHTEHKFYILGS